MTDRQLAMSALVGVALVVVGTAGAAWVTTAGGNVDVSETTFETESGIELAATVYAPAEASANDPAPAVVLIHGYGGERGTLNSFAIELARRGYVAVTVDSPGHGESGGAVGDDGYGGPAALEAVRSMAIVDEDRVAVGGHSMGGFASLEAARAHPDGYASIVLISSSWDADDDVDESRPRNMAVVFGRYDELSSMWWDEPAPGNARHSEKLAAAVGTDPPIEHGRVYGDVEAGTARTLTAPPTIHIGMHRSTAAVGDTVEWVTLTTDGPTEPATDDQRWYWAFLGHVLALVGALVVAVAATGLAWRRLGGSRGPPETGRETPRRTALVLTALPALALYPLYVLGSVLVPVTRLTPQQPTHGYLVWALGAALLAAGVVRWRHGGIDRESIRGIGPDRSTLRRALAAAAVGAGVLYLVATLVDLVPGGALRAWVFGFGTLTPVRWFAVAVYVLPFLGVAVALSTGLHRVVGPAATLGRDLVRQLGVAVGGLLGFLAIQYVPLFLGYGLPIEVGLLSSVAIFATAYLALATVVSTACYRVSGSVWPGGLLAGLLVTWAIVGTGPLHVAPF